MRGFIAHLRWLRAQAVDGALAGVPDQKVRQFAAEARTLNAADLGRLVEARRLALMVALLRRQAAQALDDLAEMFVRLTQRMHARAKDALEAHRTRHAEDTDGLVPLLREAVLTCRDGGPDRDARLTAVEQLLLPDAVGILARCEAHAALAGNNYLPLLARFYKGQRAAFLCFLAEVAPVSTSQDRSVEAAIGFLLDRRTHRHPKLKITREETGADGTRVTRRLIDLSFVGERWWPLVTGQAVSAARDPERVTEGDRRYFEICLFSQAVNELKGGGPCIPGGEAYGDYREQLVSWEAPRRDVAAYADQAGVSADAATFVAGLKARLLRGWPESPSRRHRGHGRPSFPR